MSNVKMKAVDTLHVSNAGPDNIGPGETFEVNETDAKQLEDRGLAVRVKAAPDHANKQAPEPANKSAKHK